MKSKISIILLIFFSVCGYAQKADIVAGGNGNYMIPVFGLGERFEAALGGSFYIGKKVSDSWTWTGKAEYVKLTKLKRENLKKKAEAEINGQTNQYTFDLPSLSMEFTAAGISAEAKYNIWRTELFEANLNTGFGFFYWEFFRGSYQDSLAVDSSGSGDFLTVAVLDVPSTRQRDWSGGFNFGLDFNIMIFDPVWLNLSGNYKLIIGEIWPTLALDLENVSGFQFIDLKAGVKISL